MSRADGGPSRRRHVHAWRESDFLYDEAMAGNPNDTEYQCSCGSSKDGPSGGLP